MKYFSKPLLALAAASFVTCGTAHAQAQGYPNKFVKFIVTYPPGGSSDVMARIIGQKLTENWGQQVLIENRGGATGTILAGVFAVAAVGDTAGLLEGNGRQVLIQLGGVGVVLAWSGIVTFVLLKVIAFFQPLRVAEEHERIGLDVSLHGEALQ